MRWCAGLALAGINAAAASSCAPQLRLGRGCGTRSAAAPHVQAAILWQVRRERRERGEQHVSRTVHHLFGAWTPRVASSTRGTCSQRSRGVLPARRVRARPRHPQGRVHDVLERVHAGGIGSQSDRLPRSPLDVSSDECRVRRKQPTPAAADRSASPGRGCAAIRVCGSWPCVLKTVSGAFHGGGQNRARGAHALRS
jgi:hypothetical protein